MLLNAIKVSLHSRAIECTHKDEKSMYQHIQDQGTTYFSVEKQWSVSLMTHQTKIMS